MLNDSENKAQASLSVLNDPAKVEKALQEKKVTYIFRVRTLVLLLISPLTYFEKFYQRLKTIGQFCSSLVQKCMYDLRVSLTSHKRKYSC